MAISDYDALPPGVFLMPDYLENLSQSFGGKPNQFTPKSTLKGAAL
jgi:hypothetical protein